MKYLIIGLGNVGAQYELNRHNIGFLILDRLADVCGGSFEEARLGFQATIRYKGRTLVLLKPSTWMNNSGKAVNYWMQIKKIPVTRLLVVVDDISLPFGILRIRARGSSAGHNGLKSIEETIGRLDYPRLRFGIGNNFGQGKQSDYVLSNFDKNEMVQLTPLIDKACDSILAFCTIGINRTMNQFNS